MLRLLWGAGQVGPAQVDPLKRWPVRACAQLRVDVIEHVERAVAQRLDGHCHEVDVADAGTEAAEGDRAREVEPFDPTWESSVDQLQECAGQLMCGC
ncbi:MAG: hypothetical protein ACRDYX_00110 [Egibacteraceae bacterium]